MSFDVAMLASNPHHNKEGEHFHPSKTLPPDSLHLCTHFAPGNH